MSLAVQTVVQITEIIYAHHTYSTYTYIPLSQVPQRTPGRTLSLPLPEPSVQTPGCISPPPPATLTRGAVQPALRSEEATFEFVKKKQQKQQKTTKAPNQTNTARHGRCFLQPAPSAIWCCGPGTLGHRWRARYQPCFLNTRLLSVNGSTQTHGAAGSRRLRQRASLGLVPRVRLPASRWRASESFETREKDAATQVRGRGPLRHHCIQLTLPSVASRYSL